MRFDSSLKQLLQAAAGSTDCDTFRATTKANHKFALEYCARLLRFTINHHGPVKGGHIQPELRRDAMAELLGFLQAETAVAPSAVSRAPVRARPPRSASGRAKTKKPRRGAAKKAAAGKVRAKAVRAKKARTKARRTSRAARR
jgi:hypothetical protein